MCCMSCLTLISVMGCSKNADRAGSDVASSSQHNDMEIKHAYVSPAAVSSPLGKFVLIREHSLACAVRFTTYKQEGEEGKSTIFFTREPTRTAEVEWYYQKDGSFDFDKANVVSGKASLRNTSSFGIGRFSFKPTATLGFLCGAISIGWVEGIRIGFFDINGVNTFEREIAPTNWSQLKQIDFSNPQLTWVNMPQYSTGKPRVSSHYIPMEDLP